MGAWAEDYNIWIGETRVTSDNASGVTGPGISGTVTFEFDNSGSSPVYNLYLTSATLTVPIKMSFNQINIYIKGDNSITSSDGPALLGVEADNVPSVYPNIRAKDNEAATLHLKTTDGESSVAKGCQDIGRVGTYLLTSAPVDYDTNESNLSNRSYKYRITGAPVDDLTFTTVSTIEVWVAGQQVSNGEKGDILGDGTISYEFLSGYGSGTGRILTLNGFKMTETYDGHAIIFGDDGNTNYVVVKYTGENIIRCTGYPFYTAHKDGWVSASFNPQSAEIENKITMYCDAPRISYNFYENAYNNYSGDGKQYGVYPIDGGHELGVITPFGFSIGGTEMHARNLSYYDGLDYDADTHTITLDNTTLSGALKWDNEADLTILLKGSNTIIGRIYTSNYDSDLTLTLAPTEGCSLTLDNSEDYDEYSIIKDFSSLAYDGLACSVSDAVYNDGRLEDADGRSIYSATTFTYQEASYTLIVAGIEVTSENASNITGGLTNAGTPQVAFDAATHTLTLTEASVVLNDSEPFVVSSLDSLTVKLVSYSYISYNDGEAIAFKSTNPDAVLTFATDDIDEGVLAVNTSSSVEAFDGFNAVKFDGGLAYQPNEDGKMISKVYAPQIFSSMTQEGEPTFGFESEGTIHYSIDYVDESLEDVADAVYDMEVGGPALAGPCVVTAWNQVDSVRSETVIGKYFGVRDTTVLMNSDPYVPDVIPAVGEGEIYCYFQLVESETEGAAYIGQDNDVNFRTDSTGVVNFMAYISEGDRAKDYVVLNGGDWPVTFTVNVIEPKKPFYYYSLDDNSEQVLTGLTGYQSPESGSLPEWYRDEDFTGIITFTSSDPDVATIDEEGNITVVTYGGQTTISATSEAVGLYAAGNTSFLLSTMKGTGTTIACNQQWTTYCAEEDLAIPEGLEAYVVTAVSGSEVTVQAISYIPQGVGVLLERTDDTVSSFTAAVWTGEESTFSTNLLQGATENTDVTTLNGTVYVLYNDAFVLSTSGVIPANRAYLVVPGAESAGAGAPRRLTIGGLGGTTGISTISAENGSADVIFDLQGRRTTVAGKGLYIINSKKVVLK